ncbi:hypothetical protein [Sphingobacterium sp. CZ-UAM]|uniref:hypothetical protein n=1 Tax=Sphingobacterium sp. CZ-UAM TaxID=1933868 RepID=UPI001115842B|nr:hypothetical protein [Sphingobacterium sp. CZ-UAM]
MDLIFVEIKVFPKEYVIANMLGLGKEGQGIGNKDDTQIKEIDALYGALKERFQYPRLCFLIKIRYIK